MSEVDFEQNPTFHIPTHTVAIPTTPAVFETSAAATPFLYEPNVPARVATGSSIGAGQYETIAPTHGRSMTELFTHMKTIWCDEYGIPFGARNIKGTDCMNPRITAETTSPSGFRVEGMRDVYSASHVVSMSEYIRSIGLPTERITRIEMITALPDGRTVEQFYREEINRLQNTAFNQSDKIKKSKLIDLIKKVSEEPQILLAVYRDVQSDYRLADFQSANQRQFDDALSDVFIWLKHARKLKSMELLWEGIPSLEPPITPEIKYAYLTEYLPTVMGRYLGSLHSPKTRDGVTTYIVHKYPHAQNWSIVGTLYDLDSATTNRCDPDRTVIMKHAQGQDLRMAIDQYRTRFLDGNSIDIGTDVRSVYLAVVHMIQNYCKKRYHEELANPLVSISDKTTYALRIFHSYKSRHLMADCYKEDYDVVKSYYLDASKKLEHMMLDHISQTCLAQKIECDNMLKGV